MVTKEKVLEALKNVIDPEIGLNIVELNMVRDVKFEDGRLSLLIALTVPSCPLVDTIKEDVTRALMNLKDVESVSVETISMSKEELKSLASKIQNIRRRKDASSLVKGSIDRLDKKGIRKIVAIISGKGGVGKSFVTSLLASELRRQGFDVGVLDADITGPSIAKIFGVDQRPVSGEYGVIPVQTNSGIKIISMNLLLDTPTSAVIWRGPIINSVIRQLYNDVDWGELHYLLIDLPPGTGDAPLTVFQSIPLDGVIVVTTPQELATMIVTKAINMAKTMKIPILGLIENMKYLTCPHCSKEIELFGPSKAKEVAEEAGIPYLGAVPIDSKIVELSDQGRIEDYQSEAFNSIAYEFRSKILMKAEMPIAWSKDSEMKSISS